MTDTNADTTTLLIPTDGSDRAEAAARRGFALAEELGAAVDVLSVADSSVATGAGYSGDSESIRAQLRETAEERATALATSAGERGLEATVAVRERLPAEEIVAYAESEGIDLVVMGTSGRGGLARAVVGSVTDEVVRTAPVPVVTIAPEAIDGEATVGSVLLPTDGSDPARAGASRGLALAEELGATVHALSVVDPDADSPAQPGDRATDHLGAIAAEATDRGLSVVTATVEGDPATEIVAYAESEGIDLIAMGTAGRGGVERALVGSVTDDVLGTAPVPVLTVGEDAGLGADSETADQVIRVGFVCVQNAGRSQMATAFARRERDRRGLDERVEIVTGGTHPADRVHGEVIEAMAEVGVDLSDRTPREVSAPELRSCAYVATMGCSTLDVGEVGDGVAVRDWALEDPDGKDPAQVREIRAEVEKRVAALFDEIEREIGSAD